MPPPSVLDSLAAVTLVVCYNKITFFKSFFDCEKIKNKILEIYKHLTVNTILTSLSFSCFCMTAAIDRTTFDDGIFYYTTTLSLQNHITIFFFNFWNVFRHSSLAPFVL